MDNQIAIQVNNVSVAYDEKEVVRNVSIAVPRGVVLGVVGPNGAGKTSFLKALVGLIKPSVGSITFTDKVSASYQCAYVPQRSSVDWDFPATVLDVVLMGCYQQLGWFARPGNVERQQAMDALRNVDMVEHAQAHIGQLSGGQQQRVFLARALMQDAPIYLLDEPFSGIDMATEKMIITLLKRLARQGKTIIMVHHDLQTLSDYFDWILLLNVQAIAYGRASDVLMPEYMCAAYGKTNIFVQR